MRSLILPVIVVGLAASTGADGQPLPPIPPAPPLPLVGAPQAVPAPPVPSAPPLPLVASAQAAPAPAPLTPQIPAPAPAPRVAPAPPLPPPPPAPAFNARLVQAPGLLFAPQASQSYLGVHLIEVSDERAGELGMKEPYGVEIMSVASGSPAGDAGLRKRDVIIRFNGQRVEGQEQLVRLVRETPVGRQVEIGVFRNGSELNLNVEVGELKVPAPKVLFNCGAEPCEIRIPNIRFRQFDFDIPKPRMVMQSRLLGVELEPLEGQLAEHFGVKEGVLVRSVERDSPASRAGLKAGDAIVEVAGRPVRDSGHIREAVRSADPEKNIPVAVVRNRSRVALQMEPQAGENHSPDRQGRRVSRGDRP